MYWLDLDDKDLESKIPRTNPTFTLDILPVFLTKSSGLHYPINNVSKLGLVLILVLGWDQMAVISHCVPICPHANRYRLG